MQPEIAKLQRNDGHALSGILAFRPMWFGFHDVDSKCTPLARVMRQAGLFLLASIFLWFAWFGF